ncbi:hypothetical protein OA88_18130 [Flavobacterium sp. JRM]|nr:hypothetical protein OA88_18130 [Flavobacterium sp. JRM]
MKFSQRIGKTPVKILLQIESIDVDLKNRLWNIILEKVFNTLSLYEDSSHESEQSVYAKLIWKEFFNYPVDTINKYDNGKTYFPGFTIDVREWFFKAEWYQIFDFLEFVCGQYKEDYDGGLENLFNQALEKEVSAYRLVNSRIIEITSSIEIEEIESAIDTTDSLKSVNQHLATALNFLADRNAPDYRNSIKESISAVESYCKIITGDNSETLGKALNEIEKSFNLHRALKSAFSSLYGYASDTGGIRHSLLEGETPITFEEAKFMLVSCSAFINYLKGKLA